MNIEVKFSIVEGDSELTNIIRVEDVSCGYNEWIELSEKLLDKVTPRSKKNS